MYFHTLRTLILILLGLAGCRPGVPLHSAAGLEGATRTDIELYSENRDRFVLTAGDSVPIDACVNDGRRA